NMIRRDRPTFVMEILPYGLVEQGANLEQLLNFLTPIGYRLYDERTEALLPSEAAALERMIGEGASWNVIARAAGVEQPMQTTFAFESSRRWIGLADGGERQSVARSDPRPSAINPYAAAWDHYVKGIKPKSRTMAR